MLGGLGVAGVAVDAGCSTPRSGAAGAEPAPLTAESLTTEATTSPDPITIEQVQSPARSTAVQLVTIRPAGVAGRLPVCLALHGRSANARMFLDLGVPDLLNKVVANGVKPFAVAAVDGGDDYWVARKPDDDPQRMLLQDLPIWLGNRGFKQNPFAVMGISMGGYGALNYARNPGLSAAAAISAALFNDWTDAKKRNAFANEAAWEATEPLRHVADLKANQLGVWCGTGDPFISEARRLVDTAHPRISAITSGDHTDPYWRRILPEVLRFIGGAAP